MKKSISLLICCVALVSQAQFYEYLVTVNPATGNFSRIDSLKLIKQILIQPAATTMDKVNGRYYFVGMNSYNVSSLYSADVNSGAVRKHGPYSASVPGLNYIGHLEFDDSTGNIYGLAAQIPGNKTVFFKLDTSSAAITTISVLQNVSNPIGFGHQYTYDQNGHRYFFTASINGTNNIISIDALTGNTLAATPLPAAPFQHPYYIRYNNANSTLYGLYSNNSGPVRLIAINLVTGMPSATIATIPNSTIVTSFWPPNRATIDEVNNRFTFIEHKANPQLITIDLSSGNIISSPTFTAGLSAPQNVIEILYNNANGKLYALHWGDKDLVTEPVGVRDRSMPKEQRVVLSPNPSERTINLCISKIEKLKKIRVYKEDGFLITSLDQNKLSPKISIPCSQAGVYIVECEFDDGVERKKAVVLGSKD